MIDAVLALLAGRGHDFRDYRRDLLERRIGDRMATVGERDPLAYVARVAGSPSEVDALADTILITTTAFFRDPESFAALGRLFGDAPLRAWVAGAATGEEAWSLAMVLPRADILASDVSARAIEVARAGRYPGAVLPPEHRHHLDAGGAIAAPLRARVRFARHDLLGPQLAPPEAVLARFDLVLCRNVLIYLLPRLQERLLDRLSSVVAPGGVLGLGPYEAAPREDLAAIAGAPPELRRKR